MTSSRYMCTSRIDTGGRGLNPSTAERFGYRNTLFPGSDEAFSPYRGCSSLRCFGAAIARGEISGERRVVRQLQRRLRPPRPAPRPRRAGDGQPRRGIKTADGARPPQLRRITLAVNRYGRLSTKGCRSATRPARVDRPHLALTRCRPALVGHGEFIANVAFPDRDPFPVEGRMLAFNGRAHGQPAILLHIHGSNPVDVTVVLTFAIQHPRGASSAPCSWPRSPSSPPTSATSPKSRSSSIASTATAASAQLPQRPLRRPVWLPGAMFSFTRGHLPLRRRQADHHHAGPRLRRPLDR